MKIVYSLKKPLMLIAGILLATYTVRRTLYEGEDKLSGILFILFISIVTFYAIVDFVVYVKNKDIYTDQDEKQ